MSNRRGPVVIDLEADAAAAPSPADAAPVPDSALPDGRAMQVVATLGARRGSVVVRVFWAAALSFIGFAASLSAWAFVERLLLQQPILGAIAAGLGAILLLTLLVIAVRELAAISRLSRLDTVRQAADRAMADRDLEGARRVAGQITALYANRSALAEGRATVSRRREEVFEAESLMALVETELLAPLDRAAEAEIEAAARQVATVTALVPIALADVVAALTANLRMIRRIAEVYGGRSGTLGAWRLTRAVLTHLVATGAVAIGDDLVGSALGGSVLSKLSRRFGEGIVNGALTARVGVAAMEVCRPLAFGEGRRPSVTGLVKRALTGLFGQRGDAPQ